MSLIQQANVVLARREFKSENESNGNLLPFILGWRGYIINRLRNSERELKRSISYQSDLDWSSDLKNFFFSLSQVYYIASIHLRNLGDW